MCWSRGQPDRDRLRRALCFGRRARAPAVRFVADEIARRAMKIAAGICVFTNENVTIETLAVASL